MDLDHYSQAISEKPPVIARQLSAPTFKTPEKNVITDDGPFAQVKLPSLWQKSEAENDMVKYSAPSAKNSGILFGTIEKHPTEKSFAAFVELLKDADSGKRPRLLFEKGNTITPELRKTFEDIASAIVYDHVGANQLCASSETPGQAPPAYDIDKAQVVKLNGRNVLLIYGGFVADGKRYIFDQELFVPDLKYKQTYNLCLYAKSKEDYEKLVEPFKHVLESIKWNSAE
jgi:hypothetical protein